MCGESAPWPDVLDGAPEIRVSVTGDSFPIFSAAVFLPFMPTPLFSFVACLVFAAGVIGFIRWGSWQRLWGWLLPMQLLYAGAVAWASLQLGVHGIGVFLPAASFLVYLWALRHARRTVQQRLGPLAAEGDLRVLSVRASSRPVWASALVFTLAAVVSYYELVNVRYQARQDAGDPPGDASLPLVGAVLPEAGEDGTPMCAVLDCDCSDFPSRTDAQMFLAAVGPRDPHNIDRDDDGRACEQL